MREKSRTRTGRSINEQARLYDDDKHDIIWKMASAQPGYDTINFKEIEELDTDTDAVEDTDSNGSGSTKKTVMEIKRTYDIFRNLDRPMYCQCLQDAHVSFS